MPRSREEDIAARVARRLGLAFTETVVLNRGTNVLVHLRPTPVLARVTRLAHLVRPVTDLAGAIALARSDALRGRLVAPTTLVDPGPYVEDARYVTLWTYYPGGPSTPLASPAEAGSSLRLFHESARGHAVQYSARGVDDVEARGQRCRKVEHVGADEPGVQAQLGRERTRLVDGDLREIDTRHPRPRTRARRG